MKHQFKGGMTVGTPDNPPEGYSHCGECGAEETDDNKDEECAPVEDDDSVVAPILPPYDDGLPRRADELIVRVETPGLKH